MMNNYAMYLRKSRSDEALEQLGEGETLAKHEHILNELAAKHHYNITNVYREIVSGEMISSRPQMIQLLSDIKQNKFEGVLVVEVERLARGDTKDQGEVAEAFKMTNTKIITPLKTYDPNNEYDEEYFEFGLFMSRREYKTIKRRMQRGVIESVKQGNYIGAGRPYGYDILKINKKERTLTINEDEAKVVRLIYDLHVNKHFTPNQIKNELYMRGIKTQKGLPEWNRATITLLLSNIIYTGKIRWKNKRNVKEYVDGTLTTRTIKAPKEEVMIVEGKHEAIISDEMFNKAQSLFKGNAPIPKGRVMKNPLAGLIVCKQCGHAMGYRSYQKAEDRMTHKVMHTCNMKSAMVKDLMEGVVDYLKTLMDDTEIKIEQLSHENSVAEYDDLLKTLQSELEKSESKKTKLYEFLEDGIYTKEVFAKRMELIDNRINDLKDKIQETENNKPDLQEFESQMILYSKAIETLLDKNIPAKEKNIFLKSFIDKIEYESIDLGRKHGSEIHLNIIFK